MSPPNRRSSKRSPVVPERKKDAELYERFLRPKARPSQAEPLNGEEPDGWADGAAPGPAGANPSESAPGVSDTLDGQSAELDGGMPGPNGRPAPTIVLPARASAPGAQGRAPARVAGEPQPAPQPANDAVLPPPWRGLRAGQAQVELLSRASPDTPAHLQPWARQLLDVLLTAADDGGLHLCLLWPVQLDAVAVLHGLMNLERNFARDMRGARTVLFPGTSHSRLALDAVRVGRGRLRELYRGLWRAAQGRQTTTLDVHTDSTSFVALLGALIALEERQPEVPHPSLSELYPAFLFEAGHGWRTVVENPFERSLRKVQNRSHREELREKLSSEWRDPIHAPGALMVLHQDSRKAQWRAALNTPALRAQGAPALFLLDATDTRSFASVARIPEFIEQAHACGHGAAGTVIVTDNPATFFSLRRQLVDAGRRPEEHVWAAEAETGSTFVSASPKPEDWTPAERSLDNPHVSVVDRHASSLALKFQQLARQAGNEDSEPFQALMEACHYLVRLSNMPAGYADLTQAQEDGGMAPDPLRRNAWTRVAFRIDATVQAGALATRREQLNRALARAEKLLDQWDDATPLAFRLLEQVKRHMHDERGTLCLVLPSQDYVGLAQRFMQRKFGSEWDGFAERLQWFTLASLGRKLAQRTRAPERFAFVGVNRNVLRVLLAHPGKLHGAMLFLPYKQADSTVKTLHGLKTLDALKAYRGRISLLLAALEERLAEISDPVDVAALAPLSFTFKLELPQRPAEDNAADAWRFELEGGGWISSSGSLYRYDPSEEPVFRRVQANQVQPDDFVFEMSAELREKVQDVFGLRDARDPARQVVPMMLQLYRKTLQGRCRALFKDHHERLGALARAVLAKMAELDPELAQTCRVGRVRYWLGAQESETTPHGASRWPYFQLFCAALEISEESAKGYWTTIHNARQMNQSAGRELARQYAEILFQPESAAIYNDVSLEQIQALQREALGCLHRVVRVISPSAGQR